MAGKLVIQPNGNIFETLLLKIMWLQGQGVWRHFTN